MGLDKAAAGKIATYIGYTVYILTAIYGAWMLVADPTTLYGNFSPTPIQIGGLLLIAYGIVQIVVTIYNRLPPTVPKTAEQIAVDKSKMRERNDKKSKERKQV